MRKENYLEIAQIAVKAIDSKRGEDIELIKVSDITVLTDYFVIASANSKHPNLLKTTSISEFFFQNP